MTSFPMTDDQIRLAQIGILNIAVKTEHKRNNDLMRRFEPHVVARSFKVDFPAGPVTAWEFIARNDDGSLRITEAAEPQAIWNDGMDVYGIAERANRELHGHGLWEVIPTRLVRRIAGEWIRLEDNGAREPAGLGLAF